MKEDALQKGLPVPDQAFPPYSNLSTWPLYLTLFMPLHQARFEPPSQAASHFFRHPFLPPGLSEGTYLGFSTSVPKMDLSRPALRVIARCVYGRRPLGDLHPRLESIPATSKTERCRRFGRKSRPPCMHH